MSSYLPKFLVCKDAHIAQRASKIWVQLVEKTTDLSSWYDKATCMVGSEDNMFETINNRNIDLSLNHHLKILELENKGNC